MKSMLGFFLSGVFATGMSHTALSGSVFDSVGLLRAQWAGEQFIRLQVIGR
ncbi:MAG TPA: hypothetical protein VHY22_10645 [Chthoniobacteraceae bacterium]|jgi:hypothetical protein|nr:hypothetical protein [Chthoniobacteraceae bacterium]